MTNLNVTASCSRRWASGSRPPTRGQGARHRRLRKRGRAFEFQTAYLQVLTPRRAPARVGGSARGRIDHHCHPFASWPFQLSAVELRSAFTEALGCQLAERHVATRSPTRDAIRRVAGELRCEPTEAAVLAYRMLPPRRIRKTPTSANRDRCHARRRRGFAAPGTFTLTDQEQDNRDPRSARSSGSRRSPRPDQSANDPREWFGAVRAALRARIDRGRRRRETICAYRATLKLQPVDTDALGVDFSALRLRDESRRTARLAGTRRCHALLFEAARNAASSTSAPGPLRLRRSRRRPRRNFGPSACGRFSSIPPIAGWPWRCCIAIRTIARRRISARVFPDVYMTLSLTIPFARS